MAKEKVVDELVVKIKADLRELKKQLKNVEGSLKTTGKKGQGAFVPMAAGAGAAAGAMKKLAGPAAILAVVAGTAKLIGSVSRVGMEFEDLKDSLDTVFGSVEEGDRQFKRILDFAQTTPFQIDTVTKAFISLRSVGIEPSQRQMQTFADTASVAIDQRGAFEALVRVQQRAAAGALGLQELNMLADRGIDVFKGLKEELGLSRLELADFGQTADGAQIIIEAMTKVLEEQFGGAMISKMDNLSVATSNMAIAFKTLGNELFEGGMGQGLKMMVTQTTRIVNNLAIAMAEMRGVGLGISLETPQFKTDMTFDQKQSERGRAAIANIEKINNKLRELKNITDNERGFIANAVGEFIASPTIGFSMVDNVNRSIKQTISMLTDLDISNESASEVVKNLTIELVKQKDAFTESTKSQQEYNDEQIAGLLTQGKMASVIGIVQKHQEKILGNTKLLTFGQENLNEIFTKYKLLLEDIGITSEKQLGEVFGEIAGNADKLATVLDGELKQAVVSSSQAFATDLVNSLMNAENALDSFKTFAQNMVAQILSIFLQLKVINPILNSIFNAGLPVGGGGGSGSSPSGGFIPSMNAGGGAVQQGMPTIVGERGAEIFIPNTSGRIMNNMNSKNAMGGGSPVIVNQSINFATGIVPTVRAEILSLMPQIADVSKAAVSEAAARGGNFRRVLQGG
jgi:hypothetical protein